MDRRSRSKAPLLEARLAEHAGDTLHRTDDMVVISAEDDYFRLARILGNDLCPSKPATK